MLDLSEVAPPSADSESQVWATNSRLTAAQQIHFYSSEDWEEFVREWVTALRSDYERVLRVGGSGDKGVDIIALRTPSGFEGPWDNYQCKHYGRPLRWADLLVEMIKVFRYSAAGEYTLPEKYVFVAPQGVTGPVARLLLQPTALKEKFLAEAPAKVSELEAPAAEAVLRLAAGDAFTRFSAAAPTEVVDAHRATPYHAIRFGTPLPQRGGHGETPSQVEESEAGYVEQLMSVYEERWQDFDRGAVESDARTADHFRRQRVRFFEAESLRGYARDSVPPGSFTRFQDAIFSGVIDIAELDHPSGWERLQRVLAASGQLSLQSHALVAVAEQDDLKGVCHQLANDARLSWVAQ